MMKRESQVHTRGQAAGSTGRAADSTTGRLTRRYGDALRVGDPHIAAGVIDDAVGSGLSSVEIQTRVIAPAMHWIGRLWERGGLTIAQEHLATAVSHHVLTRLYRGLLRSAPRPGDAAVVAAVHGEHHVLGLRMVADVCEGAGFNVRFLGADVPASSLEAWVVEHRPSLVALGVTMPLSAAALERQLRALRDLDPKIRLVIGGAGVPPALRRCAGVTYAESTERLNELIDDTAEAQGAGEMAPDVARGGVLFGRFADSASEVTDGLEARLAQTTAAAADAARGESRRAFVLEQIAFRDPLTQLWNRRAFDDRYEELLSKKTPLTPAVLMLDVDRFKAINDGFGHAAGDRVLVGVARCLTAALRPSDFAARYGGDEFVVLLPDTSPSVAADVGERIRSLIESDLADPQVTVSIGVTAPDHADRRRAALDVDRALYEAKEGGRNQVATA